MPGDWSPRSRRSPWPASECSRYPRPRRRPDRVPVTSTQPRARPAWPRTAPCARSTPPTTGRCTRSSAPRTAPPPTSDCSRPAATRTPASRTSFCAHTTCVITELYDQSGRGNNLTIEGPGGAAGGDVGANAAALPVTAGGHKVYGVYINGQSGYRDNSTLRDRGQRRSPRACTWSPAAPTSTPAAASTTATPRPTPADTGNGHMDAVNLATYCYFSPCIGQRPVGRGRHGERPCSRAATAPTRTTPPATATFVTAVLKNNGQTTFALKGGNAQSGGLTTWWNGRCRPSGYAPMHQEGAIVLGTGGDNSNASIGSFFEGVMTSGFPTDAADNAVQANIVAVGYCGRLRRPARHRGHDHRPRRQVRRRRRRRHRRQRRGGPALGLPVLRRSTSTGPTTPTTR